MTGALIRLRPLAWVLNFDPCKDVMLGVEEYLQAPKNEVCIVLRYNDTKAYVKIVTPSFGVVWTHADNVEYV